MRRRTASLAALVEPSDDQPGRARPASRGHHPGRHRAADRRRRQLRLLPGRHRGARRERLRAAAEPVVRHVRPGARVLPPARAGARPGAVAPPRPRRGRPAGGRQGHAGSGRSSPAPWSLGHRPRSARSITSQLLRRRLGDARRADRRVPRLRPGAPLARHHQRPRTVPGLRRGARRRRRRAHRAVRACWPPIGISTAGPYGFAVAVSPLFGVAWVAWRRQLRTDPGPPADWQEVTPNLGWLLLGSVFAAGLVNAGPVAANILAEPNQSDLVTAFGKGVLLARIPLFLFQAVQAALLPAPVTAGGAQRARRVPPRVPQADVHRRRRRRRRHRSAPTCSGRSSST